MFLTFVLSQTGYFFVAEKGTIPTWLLILFLVLGSLLVFLIIAVIVYFVLREMGKNKAKPEEKDAASAPVEPGITDAEVTYLPVDTMVKDGLYQVKELLLTSEGMNVYVVQKTQPLYLCPQCQAELGNDASAFCRSCGAALDVIPPTYPTYLMREAEAPGSFASAERLISMNLKHPSLILPVEVFAEKVLSLPRQYLIEPGNQEYRLSEVSTPLPLDTVLDSGISLAEGMAYLHAFNVILNDPTPSTIAYQNGQARWICYDHVTLLTDKDDQDHGAQFSANVKALADLMQSMLSGPESSPAGVPLPDAVSELFQHYTQPEESATAENMVRSLRHAVRMLGGHNNVKYRIGAQSDVGRNRELNEDSMLSHDLSSQFKAMDVTVVVAGVADGVGGHAAGEVASQLTVATLETHIAALQEEARIGRIPDPRNWLGESASEANEMVYKGRTEAGNNMACTLVLAFLTGDMATIINVGDSRGYHMNARGIRQITTDHSLVERLVAIGEITREQARHHPRKSVIYRVIGDRLKLEYDVFEQTFVPGEALLMCSDGLTDMVEDATIWRIWRSSTSPQEAVEKLVAEANTAGGIDNITVVIVEIVA